MKTSNPATVMMRLGISVQFACVTHGATVQGPAQEPEVSVEAAWYPEQWNEMLREHEAHHRGFVVTHRSSGVPDHLTLLVDASVTSSNEVRGFEVARSRPW